MAIKSAWLHLQDHACGIMRCHSLQERRGVRMSRCEMWAQAVGEIRFLGLHRDDRQAGRPSARSASLIQDGSHSRTSWHLMVQVWGGHYWWQRGETSVCSNYVKYLKSFSAWSNFVRRHLPTMKHLSVTQIHKKWTICLSEKVICVYLFFMTMASHFIWTFSVGCFFEKRSLFLFYP